jgi:hypothetical protein
VANYSRKDDLPILLLDSGQKGDYDEVKRQLAQALEKQAVEVPKIEIEKVEKHPKKIAASHH